MIDAGRLRPTALTIVALVGLVWAVGFGAVREFVWADLRAGLIDLRGLSRATRGLVLLGFGILFLMVGTLLLNDVLRASFPLIPMTLGTPGRGSLVPVALLPLTMFLLALAWTFALTGALHSHWAIRVSVLLLYLFTAIAWSTMGIGSTAAPAQVLAGIGGVLAVPVLFVVRWRARPRPAVEFTLLLLFVGTTLVMAQARSVESWRQSGVPLGMAVLASNLISMSMLVFPLLLLVGLNIADFTQRAAGWAADIAEARLPAWVVQLALAGLVVWRVRDVAAEFASRLPGNSLQAVTIGYGGALGIPLGTWLIWWLVARQRRGAAAPLIAEDVSEAGEAHAPKLVLAYVAISVVTVVLFDLVLAVLGLAGVSQTALAAPFLSLVSQMSAQSGNWQTLLASLCLVAVYPLARRGRRALALFLGAFGVRGAWLALVGLGGPLNGLNWEGPEPVNFWWVVIFVAFGAAWLAQRQMTSERAGRLIFLLLITYLLGQTDFISNPFSPFFSFAGIGFVAFGIVWDAVTIGSWANRETRGLPRVSRIFLYLGYVLLSVTLINWVLTSHDIKDLQRLTGSTALLGLSTFGKPLLYAIYITTLMLPARTEAGTPTGDDD